MTIKEFSPTAITECRRSLCGTNDIFFFSSRRRHTRCLSDWSSDVCSSDLVCGSEIWDRAIRAGINLAMEASVAGGIPIHAVLREGISGDRVVALYGILNGTSNYILTEMEKRGAPLAEVLAEAQSLGYAEADPSADIDGYDAR